MNRPFSRGKLPLEKRLRAWIRRETDSGMVFATLTPLCAPLYSLLVEVDCGKEFIDLAEACLSDVDKTLQRRLVARFLCSESSCGI